MRKALVILSGGQDSTTCLAQAIHNRGRENVHAITFDYGQRHSIEVYAAKVIVEAAGIFHCWSEVDIPNILLGTSPLVNKKVAVEQYADAQALPGGLEKTFVPMRNVLFLTIAANRAAAIASQCGDDEIDIVTGLSQEDYGGYPDCRLDFVTSMEKAILKALDDPSLPDVFIETPLLTLTKKATVELSEQIPGARTLLAWSHTCYQGEVPPCGKCHACLLRAKGYEEACVVDPLIERLTEQGVIAA